MSESASSACVQQAAILRIPVDKPQLAVRFLHERGEGVMDMIAHFWERLPQTPPLLRSDLHLVLATTADKIKTKTYNDLLNGMNGELEWWGAMLYVPKAHRADVLALNDPAAAAFVHYITAISDGMVVAYHTLWADNAVAFPADRGRVVPTSDLPFGGTSGVKSKSADVSGAPIKEEHNPLAIDFLTGGAAGVHAMAASLLPLVHKRSPARQLVNIVMQLPGSVEVQPDSEVRLATDADIPALNRWRKLYKEERGILFDADVDAWVDSKCVFVLEHDSQVVSVAKFDLELTPLVEIGGVYTFPEARQKGYGARIVSDLACRIRAMGKTPTLQVDCENDPALDLYLKHGWVEKGKLARIWLTG